MKKKPASNRSVTAPALIAALLCLPLATPVPTQAIEIAALQDLRPMSKAQLAKYRGGFKMGNYDIAFGIDIKGWVDGVLKTSLNFTVGDLSGAVAQHTVEKSGIQVIPGVSVSDPEDLPDGDSAGATNVISSLNLQADTPEEMAKLLIQNGVINNLITNTQDGVKIEQLTKITLAVTNFNAVNPTGNSAAVLQAQLKGLGGFTGLR